MKISINEFSAPLAFAFANGLIFATLFIIRGFREERPSDRWLGMVIIAACVSIMDWMLGYMGIHILWEELFFFPLDIGLVIGPLMYFYLKSQLNNHRRFEQRDYWHFLPFAIYCIYHLIIFSQGAAFTRKWSDTIHFSLYIGTLEGILVIASNLVYFSLTLRYYQHYRKWTPNQFSNPDPISFQWFRAFLVVFFVAFVVSWTYSILGMLGVNFSYTDIWWQKLMVAAMIYYIGLKGYTQVQTARLVYAEEGQVDTQPKPETDLPDLEAWKAKLLRVMSEGKAYLEPELSLSDLSARLKIPNSLLSAVINKGFGKNFNDFVNEYRVKEFQNRVRSAENKHISLLGIAFDSGFNSKATFNRVYKKMTGQSPKEALE